MTENSLQIPPDVIDLLLKDHERLRLKLLEATPKLGLQSGLDRMSMEAETLERLKDLRSDLESHLYIEEQVLYPYCSRFDVFNTIITRCHEEHRTARSELQDALQTNLPDDRIRKSLQFLRADLEKHFSFEEKDLFPQIRKHVKRLDREELAKQLESARLEWRRGLKRAA